MTFLELYQGSELKITLVGIKLRKRDNFGRIVYFSSNVADRSLVDRLTGAIKAHSH